MDKIQSILCNPDYISYLEQNCIEEEKRIYCPHNFEHQLDVARLTYILVLESGNPFISREMSYAAGLLHDIGRWKEYRESLDHARVSADMASNILKNSGFSDAEIDLIVSAISKHRHKDDETAHSSPLSRALARADSLSRLCFNCTSRETCNKLNKQPTRDTLIY